MYIYGKEFDIDVDLENPNPNDYFLLKLEQENINSKGGYQYSITIEANRYLQLDEDKVIERVVKILLSVVNTESEYVEPIRDMELKKSFGNGYFIYAWKKDSNSERGIGSMLPREILSDYILNNENISQMMMLDERTKVEKEKGGSRIYITINNFQSIVKNTSLS